MVTERGRLFNQLLITVRYGGTVTCNWHPTPITINNGGAVANRNQLANAGVELLNPWWQAGQLRGAAVAACAGNRNKSVVNSAGCKAGFVQPSSTA